MALMHPFSKTRRRLNNKNLYNVGKQNLSKHSLWLLLLNVQILSHGGLRIGFDTEIHFEQFVIEVAEAVCHCETWSVVEKHCTLNAATQGSSVLRYLFVAATACWFHYRYSHGLETSLLVTLQPFVVLFPAKNCDIYSLINAGGHGAVVLSRLL